MTSAEAFAAVALAAVACDGSLGRDEAHALRRQLENRSLYVSCSEAEMGELFDRLLTLLRERGVGPLTVKTRFHPESAERLARSLRGEGDRPGLLAVTRTAGRSVAMLLEE